VNDAVERAPSRVTAAQSHGDTARLHATGEFDLADHEQLAETLRAAVSRGHRAVEVDFSAVTFIDAGTIRVLLQGRDFAAERGCALRIVNPAGMSVTILHATGTSELLCATVATSAPTPAAGRPAVSAGTDTPGSSAARSLPSPWCGRPPAGNTAWARLGSWNRPTASRRPINLAKVYKFEPSTDD
jgi:anti-anti-sigma factor